MQRVADLQWDFPRAAGFHACLHPVGTVQSTFFRILEALATMVPLHARKEITGTHALAFQKRLVSDDRRMHVRELQQSQ